VKAPSLIRPGYLMRVVYDEFVYGYHSVGIDELLWITQVTRDVGPEGVCVSWLQLTSAPRLPTSGEQVLSAQVQQMRSLAGATPAQIGRTSTAQGIPTYITVEEGLVTAIERQIPVANGTYNTGTGPLGGMGTITIRNGVITAITEAT